MLDSRRAAQLRPLFEGLLDREAMAARVQLDPVRFPRRYADPLDAEVAGLVAACFAYGRAELFLERLEGFFAITGGSPARFAREFDPGANRRFFDRFVYRFHTGADLAALVAAAGRLQSRDGSLGATFAAGWRAHRGTLRDALAHLVEQLRAQIDPRVTRALGPPRALDHLLPDPKRGGASKRLLLFLRWMARGGPEDPVDMGLWRQPPSRALLVPLDTHVARIALRLGLTKRRDVSWRTAEAVTDSLRSLDPEDPVRFDFALCHLGMSGACPLRPSGRACHACALRGQCAV